MRTLLFDLDGTLLPLDVNMFREEYFSSISGYCSHLVEPRAFNHMLLKATSIMIKNDGTTTNEELFMRHFLPGLNLKKETLYPVLENYYTYEFTKLRKCVKKTELPRLIIEEALTKGWRIVLATNPLFPLIAIEERMRWAEIAHFPWTYISSYENSRACKPNLFYYQELVEKLSLRPGDCWMVGNDRDEDMVAGKLGFNTFLVTDYLLGEGKDMPKPREQGSLEQFYRFLKESL